MFAGHIAGRIRVAGFESKTEIFLSLGAEVRLCGPGMTTAIS